MPCRRQNQGGTHTSFSRAHRRPALNSRGKCVCNQSSCRGVHKCCLRNPLRKRAYDIAPTRQHFKRWFDVRASAAVALHIQQRVASLATGFFIHSSIYSAQDVLRKHHPYRLLARHRRNGVIVVVYQGGSVAFRWLQKVGLVANLVRGTCPAMSG